MVLLQKIGEHEGVAPWRVGRVRKSCIVFSHFGEMAYSRNSWYRKQGLCCDYYSLRRSSQRVAGWPSLKLWLITKLNQTPRGFSFPTVVLMLFPSVSTIISNPSLSSIAIWSLFSLGSIPGQYEVVGIFPPTQSPRSIGPTSTCQTFQLPDSYKALSGLEASLR